MGVCGGGGVVGGVTVDYQVLGTVDVLRGGLVIRAGFVGRPTMLANEDGCRMTLFSEWPGSDSE